MQYTLRQVPEDLDKALRQKARKEGRSLNRVLIEVLERGVGLDRKPAMNHQLDFAIGSWVAETEVQKAIEDQRTIDPDAWK